MMKLLFSSTLFFTAFAIVSATNIDNALQYRNNNVPRGTGPSTSAAASSSANLVTLSSTETSPTPTLPPSSASESASPSTSVSTDQLSDLSSSSSPSSPSVVSSQAASSSTIPSESSDTVLTPTPTSTTPSSTNEVSSNIGDSSSSTQVITRTSISVSSKTQKFETTVVTVSGSSTFSSVFTTSGLQAVATSTTTSKSTPGLGSDNSKSGNTGLKHSQKMTIVGTVVGIGGALLLGGIALVAWRIWGKKKHQADEDHDLMGLQPGSSSHEKRSSVSDNSPFRSTLDQYHNPAGPVNTSSNF